MKKILRITLMLVLLVFLAFAVMLSTNYKTMVTASAEEVIETPVEESESTEPGESTEVETPEVLEDGATDTEASVNDSKIALGDKIFKNLGLSGLVEKHGADKIIMSNIYISVFLALVEGMLLARYIAKLRIKRGPVFKKHKRYSKEFKAAARGKEVVQGKNHKIRF